MRVVATLLFTACWLVVVVLIAIPPAGKAIWDHLRANSWPWSLVALTIVTAVIGIRLGVHLGDEAEGSSTVKGFLAIGFIYVGIGSFAFLLGALCRALSYQRTAQKLDALAAMFGLVGAAMYAYGALDGNYTTQIVVAISAGIGLLLLFAAVASGKERSSRRCRPL